MTDSRNTPHDPLAVRAFFDHATNTVTYLIVDRATGKAAVIDPVLDFDAKSGRLSTASADAVLAAAAEQGHDLEWVLETHAHADHLSAAAHIRELTGAKVAIGAHIVEVQARFGALFEAEDVVPDGRAFDRLLADGDRIALGAQEIEVLHTPGHTPACVSYYIAGKAFVGDTLFMPDYGTARADFPGGDAAALYRSIRRILALPPETRIFVGHDYLPDGRSDYRWDSTVAEQRTANVHVSDGVSEADFVAMRAARDATLAAPALILPSLQVNIRAGALPPVAPQGRLFLKLPVNAL